MLHLKAMQTYGFSVYNNSQLEIVIVPKLNLGNNCVRELINDQPFRKKSLCSQESAVLRRVEVRAISVLLRPGKECNSMRFVERGHLFPLTDLITNPNGGVPFFLLRQAGGGPDSLSQ